MGHLVSKGWKATKFHSGISVEQDLELSARRNPFRVYRIGNNEIQENSARGALEVQGHSISWDLRFHSTFRVTLSSKGWIGFSRTPHSDAVFSGQVTLDGRRFEGDPLGFGVQGHNCGYRHRKFWRWAHAYFLRPDGAPTTFEVLVYEMPFGLVFRKAVLWHNGEQRVFRNLREIRKTGKISDGMFVVSHAMDSNWRLRSTVAVEACIVCLT